MRALTVLLLSVLMLLPAPVFADARAERVLVFFNTPWLVRWGIDQGAAQMAQTSPEEAAFFSKVLRDHYDEEEVLTLLGNELASRVAAGDLEALVQFAAPVPEKTPHRASPMPPAFRHRWFPPAQSARPPVRRR